MSETKIIALLRSSRKDKTLAYTDNIFDQGNGKMQDEINKQVQTSARDISHLQSQTSLIKDTVDSISVSGGASVASAVTYDNADSELEAVNVQQAVSEIEKKKINKGDIAQNIGNSEEKLLSQLALALNYEDKATLSKIITSFVNPNYDNLYETEEASSWLKGYVDSKDGKFHEASSSYVCTDFIEKSPYGKIYYKSNRYNATPRILYYDKDKNYITSVVFPFSNYGGFSVIDEQNAYPYFRISIYGVYNENSGFDAGIVKYGTLKNEITQFETINKDRDSLLFNISNYSLKENLYSGIWKKGNFTNNNDPDCICTDFIKKGNFAPISLHIFKYSANLTIYFYDKDKKELSKYNCNGEKYIHLRNLCKEGVFFRLLISFVGIGSEVENFNKNCPIYTYIESDNDEHQLVPFSFNEKLTKSSFHSIKEKCDAVYFTVNENQQMFDRNQIMEIAINNQNDLDSLIDSFKSTIENINSGIKLIKIKFGEGLFNFKNPLSLSSYTNENLSLEIYGTKNTNLIANSTIYDINQEDIIGETLSHYIIKSKNTYDFGYKYIDENYKEIQVTDTGLMTSVGADFAVSEYDNETGNITLPKSFNYLIGKSSEYFKNSYLYIGGVYRRTICKVNNVIEQGDKIILNSTKIIDTGYTGDKDVGQCYSYSGIYPRFWITNIQDMLAPKAVGIFGDNIYIPKQVKRLYEVTSGEIISLKECSFARISIHDIHIIGSTSISSDVDRKYAVRLSNCSNVIFFNNTIENCHNGFLCKSTRKYGYTTVKNLSVYNNYFYNISSTGASCQSDQMRIYKNKFIECGYIGYEAALGFSGNNFLIKNNYIQDFCWAGMTTGQGARAHLFHNYGVVEDNEICKTSKFNNKLARYGLMDCGAFYIFTYQDGLIVRNNIIHDCNGYYNSRGIYCDDGACNLYILNNILYNIPHHAIELYRVDWKSGVNSNGDPISVDRRVLYNIVLGEINFAGAIDFKNVDNARENNGCYYGMNLIGEVVSIKSYPTGETVYMSEPNIIDYDLRAINGFIYTTKDITNWGFDDFTSSHLLTIQKDTSIF